MIVSVRSVCVNVDVKAVARSATRRDRECPWAAAALGRARWAENPFRGAALRSYGCACGGEGSCVGDRPGDDLDTCHSVRRHARAVAVAQRELEQHYPAPGWVEHDPEQIWRDTLAVAREALGAVDPARVAGIGITNQRETVVVWDRATGEPIHRAIVWQDRRTADECASSQAKAPRRWSRRETGLLLDPYFSATKIAWILDHVAGARERAERGELACGTIDASCCGG